MLTPRITMSDVDTATATQINQPGSATRAALVAKYTTAARPSASASGIGWQIYDTTTSRPLWSDGTVWRDATGTAV